MDMFKSITEMLMLGDNQDVSSNCTSIVIGNNSQRVYDASGNPLGYKVVINSVWELLPGESISFNQPLGYVDTTVYKIAFKLITGTTGTPTKNCQVARINSITNDCLKGLK